MAVATTPAVGSIARDEYKPTIDTASPRGVPRQPIITCAVPEGYALPAVLSATALFTLLVFRAVCGRYDRLEVGGFDLAVFDQALWLICHSFRPFVTVRGIHILADHFSAILYLLAPAYAAFPTAKTLLFVQIAFLASGAIPVYLLARDRTRSTVVATIFSFAYLLCPAVDWNCVGDFHPDAIATPLLLTCLYLLPERRHWRWVVVLLGVTALTKETAGITIASLGVYTAVRVDRAFGCKLVGLGIASVVVGLATMAHFNHGSASPYFALFGVGSGFHTSAVDFAYVQMEHLRSADWLNYLIQTLAPVLFLAALDFGLLAVAFLPIMMNLLSERSLMHCVGTQYSCLITPFVFAAAISGLARHCGRIGRREVIVVVSNIPIWTIMCCSWWGPIDQVYPAEATQHGQVRTLEVLRLIPASASVSAQDALLPHLSHRRDIYSFPNPFFRLAWGGGAEIVRQEDQRESNVPDPNKLTRNIDSGRVEYVILCPKSSIFPLARAGYDTCVSALLRSNTYHVIGNDGDYLVLKREGGGRSIEAKPRAVQGQRTTMSQP